METYRITTTLSELCEEYKHTCGYITLLPPVIPQYIELVLIIEDNDCEIAAQIETIVEICSHVSLHKTISCIIIENTKIPDIFLRYSRCGMAETKIVSLTDEHEDYADDSLFNINSWGADLSFRELILMYDDEELIKPDLQRKYVWSKEEASKFIDSLLLGLPVPSIFLAKVNEQKLIIDGYQRVMTVYDYVKGVFSEDKKTFKLTNSEAINPRWRGKAYSELSKDEQRRIASTTIHAIVFEQKHPANDSGMYKIFERINTSGRNLKPQEIRNCVYHGAFDTMLMEINENATWRKLWGAQQCDSRMTDVEFILRFFMMDNLLQQEPLQKRISLKKALNEYMGMYADADQPFLEELQDKFFAVIEAVWKNLGVHAFRNLTKITEKAPIQKFATSLHPAIYDAIMIATSQQLRERGTVPATDLTEQYKCLLNDPVFIDCITVRTTDVEKIVKRVSLAKDRLFGE